MKRFYKLASCSVDANGWKIFLDGKPVKTPGGSALAAPSRAMAEAIAAEWGAQKETVDPQTMPLTQILTTALDRVAAHRPGMQETVCGYLDTDLLCYRAELPAALALRQKALWDRHLAWFEGRFGAALETTTDLAALRQPAAARRAVEKAAQELDDWMFTVLQLVTSLSGSVVLALAFTDQAIGSDDVITAACIEEDYKAEIYNEAVHGAAPYAEKQRAALRRDLEAAQEFLSLIKKN